MEGDEKRVRCFGLPRRRGEEAHLARRRREEEVGEGNGNKWTRVLDEAVNGRRWGAVATRAKELAAAARQSARHSGGS